MHASGISQLPSGTMKSRKEMSALIVMAWAVFLPSVSRAHSLIVYPCTDLEAIRWVRDSIFCDQYYICHFGQPLAMPSCPTGQVWSNGALNCVPRRSRWDDCSVVVDTTSSEQTSTLKNLFTITRQPTYYVPTDISLSQSDIVVSIKTLSTVASPTGARSQLAFLRSDTKIARVEEHISPHEVKHSPHEVKQRKYVPKNWYDREGHDPFWDNDRNVLETAVATTEVQTAPTFTPTAPATAAPTEAPTAAPATAHTAAPTATPTTSSTTEPTIAPTAVRTTASITERTPLIDADEGTWTTTPLHQEEHRLEKVLYESQIGILQHHLGATLQLLNVDAGHQCFRQPGTLFPHSENCHWYINCSLANLDAQQNHTNSGQDDDVGASSGSDAFMLMQPFRVRHAGVFVWECRYPQLFDDVSGKCREFVNVDCKSRFQPVDQCEYSSRQCSGGRCIPCDRRFGSCRGRQNGVYPLHQTRWTPLFVTCYKERNIAQDECSPPTPIFSPELMDCVSLFDVPKEHGGFLPDCSTRLDGYYPDEQGRCAIFFRCALGHFRGYDECPPGSVFDPTIPACQPYSYASKPCGEGQAPLCGGKLDGLYADPYGRCTHYFQCKQGIFQQYFTCDLGIFDPLTQRCVLSAELTVRPCGLQPSPCEALPTGVYPDQATGCKHFIECHHGNMITNGTCERGTMFSATTGRCDLPEHTPPPCGVSTVCSGRPDGRYPAMARGCSFFYECYHGEFTSLRRCTEEDGGIFFNPETGSCDYPQNICPPCGYRWWGCPRTYHQ